MRTREGGIFVENQGTVAKRGDYGFHNPTPIWHPFSILRTRDFVETVSTKYRARNQR